MSASPEQPIFGRLLTIMITPFGSDGRVNLTEAVWLARHLVDGQGHDGLVVNGTTRESPTTSGEEKQELFKVVVEVIRDCASVVAGADTFDIRHTIESAGQVAEVGADGPLMMTPYYSRPPADALEVHFLTVTDATELPFTLYDIPHRMGIPIPEASLLRLVDHPRITAVKDAKAGTHLSPVVITNTTLTYYVDDGAHLLPLLTVGGTRVVGTSAYSSGLQVRMLINVFIAGDLERTRWLNTQLLPVFRGVFTTQGTMTIKAVLNRHGLGVGRYHPPMGTVAPGVLERFLGILDTRL